MFDIKDDYLAAGDALTQLLAPLVASQQLKKVYQANELSDVDERSQITPAAHVLYMGDVMPDTAQGGNTSQIKQTWLVVLACRLSIHERQAGEQLVSLLNAVVGKSVKVGDQLLGPFVRVNSPINPRFTKSHGYYPMAVTVQLRFKPS
ncbi:phage tail terminator protein [Shewanella frigidimarina]|uniref:phage tail terminator protein n=1 Tax=Shewanella frigidimarina TaxID=56812 RepID=UPI003D78E698